MEYRKSKNLLDNIPDKAPKFITKNWIEVHDQSEIDTNQGKK